MSRYFDWPSSLKRFLRGDTARAEDVNAALDQLSAGLDTLDQDVDRAIKAPPGESLDLNIPAAQRAGKVLAFDANGAPIVMTGGWRWRGDWLTATQYDPTDMFRDPISKNIYATVVGHVSSSVATDALAGKITLAVNLVDVETAKNAAAGSANAASISAGNAAGSESAAQGYVNEAQGHANDAANAAYSVASPWAPGAYTANQVVWLNVSSGSLYRCTADVNSSTAPNLDSAHWVYVGPAPEPLPDSVIYTYTGGLVTKINSDGEETTITYNVDGTVNTIAYPYNGKTRTETYSYTNGALTSVTATEI